MTRLSLFISLLLTSVAVLADVQINIRGNVYIPHAPLITGRILLLILGILILSTWTTHVVKSQNHKHILYV